MAVVGLVGCVKSKRACVAQARNLYVSPLFRGRRAYVERFCDSWWIVSAKHGLLHPREMVDPYDVTLVGATVAEKRRWARMVQRQLREQVALAAGDVVQLHCGADYREHGLAAALRRWQVVVHVPAAGLPMGQQVRFYRTALAGQRRVGSSGVGESFGA